MARKKEKLVFPIEPVLEHFGADLSVGKGNNWIKIPCPFHHPDSNPSGSYSRRARKFHCWSGCTDLAEDALGLLMRFDFLDFQAAVAEATRITGEDGADVRTTRRSSDALFGGSWSD